MSVGELSPSAVALAEMGSSRPRADSGLGLRLDRQASIWMVWKVRAMPGSARNGSGSVYVNRSLSRALVAGERNLGAIP
jgi:hypothetical protein